MGMVSAIFALFLCILCYDVFALKFKDDLSVDDELLEVLNKVVGIQVNDGVFSELLKEPIRVTQKWKALVDSEFGPFEMSLATITNKATGVIMGTGDEYGETLIITGFIKPDGSYIIQVHKGESGLTLAGSYKNGQINGTTLADIEGVVVLKQSDNGLWSGECKTHVGASPVENISLQGLDGSNGGVVTGKGQDARGMVKVTGTIDLKKKIVAFTETHGDGNSIVHTGSYDEENKTIKGKCVSSYGPWLFTLTEED